MAWLTIWPGATNGTAQSLLKQEYKDDIEVKDAIGLVLRTMSKTMDSTTLGSEKRTSLPLFPLYHPSLRPCISVIFGMDIWILRYCYY